MIISVKLIIISTWRDHHASKYVCLVRTEVARSCAFRQVFMVAKRDPSISCSSLFLSLERIPKNPPMISEIRLADGLAKGITADYRTFFRDKRKSEFM